MSSASVCLPGNATCNFVVGSVNLLTDKVEYDFFGYNVTTWVAALFVAVFGGFSLIHLGLIFWSRQYWLSYTMLIGAACETLGWSGRLWSALSVKWGPENGGQWNSNMTAFLMQISTLIFAPAFLAAANYILLGILIPILGPRYSIIHPTSYTTIFVLIDLVGLIVQAIGGGKASAATSAEEATNGGYVMLGGVIIQLVGMSGYVFVLVDFVRRYRADKPITNGKQAELFKWWPNALRSKGNKARRAEAQALKASTPTGTRVERSWSEQTIVAPPTTTTTTESKRGDVEKRTTPLSVQPSNTLEPTSRLIRGSKLLLIACSLSTLLIFIRSIYRVIELAQGWNGPIITKQVLFDTLDGMLMAFVVGLFIVFHPGWVLPRRTAWWHGKALTV